MTAAAGIRTSTRTRGPRASPNSSGTASPALRWIPLGTVEIPVDAYWGIDTARAIENFPITRRAIYNYPDLIIALARVKAGLAGACQRRDRGARAREGGCHRAGLRGDRRRRPAQGVPGRRDPGRCGHVDEHECERGDRRIARSSFSGTRRRDYQHLSPIDDVNRSQSTNDVYPTAIKLAMVFGIHRLLAEHARLSAAFARKGTNSSTSSRSGARSSKTRCR